MARTDYWNDVMVIPIGVLKEKKAPSAHELFHCIVPPSNWTILNEGTANHIEAKFGTQIGYMGHEEQLLEELIPLIQKTYTTTPTFDLAQKGIEGEWIEKKTSYLLGELFVEHLIEESDNDFRKYMKTFYFSEKENATDILRSEFSKMIKKHNLDKLHGKKES